MKLSAKARYAVRILLDLAQHDARGPVRTADIAERTGVTARFIEQILKPLKKAGLVRSTRGAAGGYALAERPEAVSLARVIRSIEGGLSLTRCCASPLVCPRSDDCRTHRAWLRVSRVMEAELEAINLRTLLDDTGRDSAGACAP